jgi:hypothetical protein
MGDQRPFHGSIYVMIIVLDHATDNLIMPMCEGSYPPSGTSTILSAIFDGGDNLKMFSARYDQNIPLAKQLIEQDSSACLAKVCLP